MKRQLHIRPAENIVRTFFALVLILITPAYSLAQERKLITNVHVFDGLSGQRIENGYVLIEGNLIKALSTEAISAGMALAMSAIGVAAILGRNWTEARVAATPERRIRFEAGARIAGAACVLVIGATLFAVTFAQTPVAGGRQQAAVALSAPHGIEWNRELMRPRQGEQRR